MHYSQTEITTICIDSKSTLSSHFRQSLRIRSSFSTTLVTDFMHPELVENADPHAGPAAYHAARATLRT